MTWTWIPLLAPLIKASVLFTFPSRRKDIECLPVLFFPVLFSTSVSGHGVQLRRVAGAGGGAEGSRPKPSRVYRFLEVA